jgi:hypothetical protein
MELIIGKLRTVALRERERERERERSPFHKSFNIQEFQTSGEKTSEFARKFPCIFNKCNK